MRTIAENLRPGVPYRVRQQCGPWLTRLAGALGQPEYRLRDTEYVGTVQQPLDEFTEALQEHGFEWDPLSWYHQPPVGSEPNGSWVSRRTPLAHRQIHVILIAHSPEYIDVFAHEEYSWLRHPIKHLRQVGIERQAGRDEMRRRIRQHDVEIEVKSRRRRRAAHALRDLRSYLGSITP
jgi:hypothetical protein